MKKILAVANRRIGILAVICLIGLSFPGCAPTKAWNVVREESTDPSLPPTTIDLCENRENGDCFRIFPAEVKSKPELGAELNLAPNVTPANSNQLDDIKKLCPTCWGEEKP